MFFPTARAFVFDLDGTLVDSYAAIGYALNCVLVDRGLEARSAEEVRGAIGHGLNDLLGRYLDSRDIPAAVDRFEAEYRKTFLETTLPLPGAAATLRSLFERGYALAVASNKPLHFSREILEWLQLLPFLSSVRGPEPGIPPKPHPAMLQACLTDLGARADAAVYVGDMVLDVESARKAGLEVALVATGSSSRAELERTGCPVFDGLPDFLSQVALRPPAG